MYFNANRAIRTAECSTTLRHLSKHLRPLLFNRASRRRHSVSNFQTTTLPTAPQADHLAAIKIIRKMVHGSTRESHSTFVSSTCALSVLVLFGQRFVSSTVHVLCTFRNMRAEFEVLVSRSGLCEDCVLQRRGRVSPLHVEKRRSLVCPRLWREVLARPKNHYQSSSVSSIPERVQTADHRVVENLSEDGPSDPLVDTLAGERKAVLLFAPVEITGNAYLASFVSMTKLSLDG